MKACTICENLQSDGLQVKPTNGSIMQIHLDIGFYKLEEINVRIKGDNLIIEANAEMSNDVTGYKYQLKERIKLHDGVNRGSIKSNMGPKGTLIIELPHDKSNQSRTISIGPLEQVV